MIYSPVSSSVADAAKLDSFDCQTLPLGNNKSVKTNEIFSSYFEYKDPSIARMRNIKFVGGTFICITESGRVLRDTTLNDWSKNINSIVEIANAVEEIHDIPTLLIGGQHNYYHWMLNWLSKILICQRSKFRSSFAAIAVNNQLQKFQIETLKTVIDLKGVDIIEVPNRKTYLFKDAIVPTIFSNPTHSLLHIDWLRKKFLGARTFNCSKRIIVSRSDAPKARRQIINYSEVLKIAQEYGFEEVKLANMSVKDQANIFATSSHVLSPHGAGLANIIFSSPGTIFGEFQAKEHYTRVFWSLGILAKDCRYNIIPCSSFGNEAPYLRNIYVEPERLTQLLKTWGM